jgi:hypothetical protein
VCTLQGAVDKRRQIRDGNRRAYENINEAFQKAFEGGSPQNNSSPLSQALKSAKKSQKKFERAERRYQRALRELRNEKERQRNRLIRENLERYKNEQPIIDSERQLSGKIVDEEVMGALEHTGYMTPQQMMLIDTVLTMPGTTVEKEYQRRIAAINAVIAFCDVEEGAPSRPHVSKKRDAADAVDALPSAPFAKRLKSSPEDKSESALRQAIASVCIKSPGERPKICFLCLGNSKLPGKERLEVFKNPGSLTRHFVNIHIKPFPKDMYSQCTICGKELESKELLINHAKRVHGIVSHLPPSALGPI